MNTKEYWKNTTDWTLDGETWRTIKRWSRYEVSSLGRVRSVFSHKVISQHINHDGYLRVDIHSSGFRFHERVNRLVAIEFVENDNPEKYDVVDHINGNCRDNRVENVRWTNAKGNSDNPVSRKRLIDCSGRSVVVEDDGNIKVYNTTCSAADALDMSIYKVRQLIDDVESNVRRLTLFEYLTQLKEIA